MLVYDALMRTSNKKISILDFSSMCLCLTCSCIFVISYQSLVSLYVFLRLERITRVCMNLNNFMQYFFVTYVELDNSSQRASKTVIFLLWVKYFVQSAISVVCNCNVFLTTVGYVSQS